jgi:arsenate reductase-like glutaredoxin family protein
MLIKICHNARFTNSKKALTPIESKDSEFKVIEYLSNSLSLKKIKLLLLN